MRRSDKEIERRAEIDAIIRDCDVCRVAFAVSNEPYVVPLSFGYDGWNLFFHTAETGKKIDCMAANPRVCFEMERNVELVRHPDLPCKWSFSFECVIGFGAVRELVTAEDKARGLGQIMAQYSDQQWDIAPAELEGVRVWCLSIESISGKRSKLKQSSG